MNVLSLFDGMSCGQIALNRSEIEYNNYYACEIDENAIKVAKHNYPKTVHLGDVRDINSSNLPKIDLLIGGSPCQSFSTAGSGTGFNGKSGLFWEYARILKEVKPTYFLLENVKMKREWRDIISNELGVQPIEINSKLVSAQNRPRLYWTNIPNINQPEDKNIKMKDILEANADRKYALSQAKIDRVMNTERGRGFFYDGTQDKCGTLIAGYYKQPTDGIYIDLGFKRRLTSVECERLQTVPDNYTSIVADSHRYKMIGNGWTVDVISHIFNSIP
jgi:DNA-cytosine methyltransferase